VIVLNWYFQKTPQRVKRALWLLQGCQYTMETKRYTTIETSRNHVRFTPTKKIAEPTVKPHYRSTAISAKQKKFFEPIHRE